MYGFGTERCRSVARSHWLYPEVPGAAD